MTPRTRVTQRGREDSVQCACGAQSPWTTRADRGPITAWLAGHRCG